MHNHTRKQHNMTYEQEPTAGKRRGSVDGNGTVPGFAEARRERPVGIDGMGTAQRDKQQVRRSCIAYCRFCTV